MIFIPICLILILIWSFQRKYALKGDRKIFYAFVLIKMICAVLVGLLYSQYYQIQGDTFTAFYQAKEWYHLFKSGDIQLTEWIGFETVDLVKYSAILPNEPRTRFFAYVLSYLMPISASNYYVTAMWMTLIEVCSLWWLACALVHQIKCNKWVVYLSLLFIPSVVFWSSGLLKETLMLTFMALMALSYLAWLHSSTKWRWGYLINIFFLAILLYYLKYYVVILWLPLGIVTHIFAHQLRLNMLSFWSKISLYFFVIFMGVFVLAIIHPVFYSGLFFELIQISHDQIAANSSESLIKFNMQSNAFLFVLMNTPLALFTAFFRPFLGEMFNLFGLFLSIENLVFTLVFIVAVYCLFKLKLSEVEKWWLLAASLYLIGLGIVITLSTPNFGTLARYRVAYMPILWLCCLYVINKHFKVSKL